MKRRVLILILLLATSGIVEGMGFNAYRPCHWWGSLDYLSVWRDKRFYPPLASTGGGGLLPATTVLFGNEKVGDSPEPGFQADVGLWMNQCLGVGIGFFTISEEEVRADFSTDQFAPLFRPAFVGPLQILPPGFIQIKTHNSFWGLDLYARYNYFSTQRFHLDILGGFLYIQLRDAFDARSVSTTAPGNSQERSDHFACENDYYSGLIGLDAQLRSTCWAINLVGKIGLGNMVKKASIRGDTYDQRRGQAPIGFLATRTNIGEHSDFSFQTVSLVGANIQLQVVPHLWLTAGYKWIYWPRVFLSGDQVELVFGGGNPTFPGKSSTFWAHGWTTGIYFLY